jgi:hypothetical protein
MYVLTNIRIKIVLFHGQICDENLRDETWINDTFQGFCKTSTVEDWIRSERLSKIKEERLDAVYDVCENEPQSSVQTIAINTSPLILRK